MRALEGKVALISGSGRGIGRAIAIKLASAGVNLVLNDLDQDVVQATAEDVEALGVNAIALAGDVTEPDFGTRFVEAALSAFGTPDIIINNAGYAWDSVLQKTTDEQWAAMLDVHLSAPFRVMRAVQPAIAAAAKVEQSEHGIARRRTIINISSVAGLGGNPGQSGYAAGKAGIIGLTKTAAKEMGRYNVTVNAVAFGAIRTRMTAGEVGASTIRVNEREIRAGVNPELLEAIEKNIPLGRTGSPEEAAGAVYILCLPEADYISGQVITAGGGWTL